MTKSAYERGSIIRTDFARDEQGNYSNGGTLRAKPGDILELGFSDVVGIGHLADLQADVRGESVEFDSIRNVQNVFGGHLAIGTVNLNAVLHAVQPGRSVVDVSVIGPDGSATGVIAVAVEVA